MNLFVGQFLSLVIIPDFYGLGFNKRNDSLKSRMLINFIDAKLYIKYHSCLLESVGLFDRSLRIFDNSATILFLRPHIKIKTNPP